jgi:hypothetical protein
VNVYSAHLFYTLLVPIKEDSRLKDGRLHAALISRLLECESTDRSSGIDEGQSLQHIQKTLPFSLFYLSPQQEYHKQDLEPCIADKMRR